MILLIFSNYLSLNNGEQTHFCRTSSSDYKAKKSESDNVKGMLKSSVYWFTGSNLVRFVGGIGGSSQSDSKRGRDSCVALEMQMTLKSVTNRAWKDGFDYTRQRMLCMQLLPVILLFSCNIPVWKKISCVKHERAVSKPL